MQPHTQATARDQTHGLLEEVHKLQAQVLKPAQVRRQPLRHPGTRPDHPAYTAPRRRWPAGRRRCVRRRRRERQGSGGDGSRRKGREGVVVVCGVEERQRAAERQAAQRRQRRQQRLRPRRAARHSRCSNTASECSSTLRQTVAGLPSCPHLHVRAADAPGAQRAAQAQRAQRAQRAQVRQPGARHRRHAVEVQLDQPAPPTSTPFPPHAAAPKRRPQRLQVRVRDALAAAQLAQRRRRRRRRGAVAALAGAAAQG